MKTRIITCLIFCLLVLTGAVKAQEKTVSGTVTDETGMPLPGATVLVVGTSNGASTDFDGKYTINVNENSVLSISYLGYVTQNIPVKTKNKINISLEKNDNILEEVIVVGYGSQRKSELTTAVVSIKPEDFSKGSNYDAAQLLVGTAAGVNVSQVSSAPGDGLKIQVRGAGSINSSNAILYVVDGLPGVDPSSLNMEDIESMEVLKDASSASIYGTRAANGVVLITTKRGKSGKTSIGYSAYTGYQHVAKTLDLLGASDYMQLINLRETTSGNPAEYTNEEIASAGEGTDWQDEILRSALVQNHNFTISGGNETGNYFVGLNYFDQEGIVKNSDFQKYNARINVELNPFNNLKISTNININHAKKNSIVFSNLTNEAAGPINAAIQYDPTIPPTLDENGRYLRNNVIALDNPLALINGIKNEAITSSVYGVFMADYEFVKNLKASVRLGANLNYGRGDFYNSTTTEAGIGSGGIGYISTTEDLNWLTEYLLKYENTFNDKHHLTLMAGTTFEKFNSRNFEGSASNFLSDITYTNLMQSGDGAAGDDVYSNKINPSMHGILGRLNYSYDNRYLLTASIRRDGSSVFSDKNKYATFPSVSVAWRLGNEPFLENSDWINELKFRIGYGQLGNALGLGNFITKNTLIARGSDKAIFGGQIQQGVVSARLPNPDLKWETTEEIDYGFDFGIFDNRISGSFDYFNRKTRDQLFNKPLPASVGYPFVAVNLGEVVNTGYDISLKTINVNGKDFKWKTSATLSFLKNEVTQLPDFTQKIIGGSIGFTGGYTVVQEGTPLRSFYGYEINGMFQEGDDIANSPIPASSGAGYAAGMPKFVDQNNDGTIDEEDRVVLGDPFPDFTFGISNTFSYKGISLDLLVIGVQGIETVDGNIAESLYPTNSRRNSIATYFHDRWTPENPSNQFPSGMNPSLYGGGRAINTLTVVDASYVRLKNITLGYSLPNAEVLKLSSLTVFIGVDNIYTLTDYKGYDPESSSVNPNNGLSNVAKQNYNSYPLARTFRVGVDVKF